MVKKNNELKACNFDDMLKGTPGNNVYEFTKSISERSKKLSNNARLAFYGELDDLNIDIDKSNDHNLVDSDIREIVSQRYEVARKPLLKALDELLADKLEVTYEEEA